MVHILLLILKIIGWILLAILGIIVLFICILLFTPVRYKLHLEKQGDVKDAKGSAVITWFFRLISFRATYEKEKLTYCIRFAWKKWKNEEKDKENFEEGQELAVPKEKPQKKQKEPVKGVKEDEEKSFEEPKKRKEKSEYILEDETVFDDSEKKDEKKSRVSQRTDKASEKNDQRDKESLIDKIKCTFKKICDKIILLREKKDKILEFIHQDIHEKAILATKNEGVRLWKNILPKQWKGKFHIGFDDPCTTGKFLAGFSVIYPFTGDHVEIFPDFETSVFEGEIFLKGGLSLCHFVATGIRLLLNKDIRFTYKDVKKIRKERQEAE